MNKLNLKFNHIFKLDPNKYISSEHISLLCESGTDAIVVGGTLGVTYEDTEKLLKELRNYSITIIQEVSDIEAIVPGFDYYLVPLVLNAQNTDLIFTAHQKALKKYSTIINWEQVIIEGYIILNQNSSGAKLTKSKSLTQFEDVLAYAVLADKLLRLPIIYIEYSGMYGNVDWVKKLSNYIEDANLYYGGGIDSINKAKEMSFYADTIVVGNIIYENLERALSTVYI